MIREDVVLFNDCGCEIARETITQEMSYLDIINSWVVYSGDKIEIQKICLED